MVVVKLGGSLLTLPDWPSRLIVLLKMQPDICPLIITGGGQIVDEIRHWDQLFSLGEETCHQLALAAMNVTARLAARLIPQAELIVTPPEAESCWSRHLVPVLGDVDRHCRELPHSWDVTSDSLAAEVARQWQADELWLLKSTGWPPGITFQDASRTGLLDNYFPAFDEDHFDVKWCNLRAEQPELNSIRSAVGESRRVAGAGALREAPVMPAEHTGASPKAAPAPATPFQECASPDQT